METTAISPEIRRAADAATAACAAAFERIADNAAENTERVLSAFRRARVSDAMFAGTTGYGYGDLGREALEQVYADVFGAEAALVRQGFVNGTHAIGCAIFSHLKAGDIFLSATGCMYDTLHTLTGEKEEVPGSLKSYGIAYQEVPLAADGLPDLAAIREAASDERVKTVFIQRSKGYTSRKSLSPENIGRVVSAVKAVNPAAIVLVDNCYGEFVGTQEPTHVGADLIAGSLIKNPGGGIVPTGGYIAGRRDLVEAAAARLTVPGIGGECGATLGLNRLLFQGFFLAPHVVGEAVKTAVFCAALMERLGYTVDPCACDARHDIIQTISFGAPDPLLRFCRGIQSGSPVDSFATPEPWEMPGYDAPVVMAAGAFVQGASIELSCDAPMREPYTAYLQGGITFESGRLGIMYGAQAMLEA